MRRHPTDLHLEAFLLDQSEERREILLHLCECARCRERLKSKPPPRPSDGPRSEPIPPTPPLTDDMRALGFAAVLAQERLEAPELFVELLRRPVGARVTLVMSDPRFRTWSVLELLIERSLATATRDGEEAEVLAALALLLADRLDAGLYGPERIEDLRARSWGHLANARRVRSDLHGAEEAFASAYDHLQRGTHDLCEEAVLLDLEGSLRRAQRSFTDAFALFRRAEELFRSAGDLHRAGRSLVKFSMVHYFAGEIAEAISVLTRAVPLIDTELEPRLRLCAQHNLIFYLTESGRIAEARRVYGETRALYRDFAEPWVQSRRKWVRARILLGLGKDDLAESLLLAARDSFLAEGIPYDTALVSLELATLYAERGRMADLKRLAGEMLPIFTALQIHREALAALSFPNRNNAKVFPSTISPLTDRSGPQRPAPPALLGMAFSRAEEAPVDLRVVPPCRANGSATVVKFTQKDSGVFTRHERASQLVDLMIAVRLCSRGDVIASHDVPPNAWSPYHLVL